MDNFYQKFKIISYLPFWRHYLRWVYKKAISDFSKFNCRSRLSTKDFTCLLCGVSGEITADEFIKFVFKNNPNTHIKIIDIGKEQVNSVVKLVRNKYSNKKIEVKQANALHLDFIKDKSIDWIETDGFFSFFNQAELKDLLKEWKRILREDGFITFRELTSAGFLSSFLNKGRAFITKIYMGVSLHLHSTSELKEDFKQLGFKYSYGPSLIPFLSRYCLII